MSIAEEGEEAVPDPDDDDAFPLPIDGVLDLHAFAPRDVVAVAEDYLRECRARGILRVRLVHGRGRGVQRAALRQLLARLDFVLGWQDAAPGDGGWGATHVSLRAAGDEPDA